MCMHFWDTYGMRDRDIAVWGRLCDAFVRYHFNPARREAVRLRYTFPFVLELEYCFQSAS